jgi:hypothetical protein
MPALMATMSTPRSMASAHAVFSDSVLARACHSCMRAEAGRHHRSGGQQLIGVCRFFAHATETEKMHATSNHDEAKSGAK